MWNRVRLTSPIMSDLSIDRRLNAFRRKGASGTELGDSVLFGLILRDIFGPKWLVFKLNDDSLLLESLGSFIKPSERPKFSTIWVICARVGRLFTPNIRSPWMCPARPTSVQHSSRIHYSTRKEVYSVDKVFYVNVYLVPFLKEQFWQIMVVSIRS